MGRTGSNQALERAYAHAAVVRCHRGDRLVFMSDAHRGIGSWNDNFMDNQNICFTALRYYYDKKFTYFELGDGDELWENYSQKRIIEMYSHIFWMLSRFYKSGRIYMLYGNHDYAKKNAEFAEKNYREYYNECTGRMEPLFPKMKMYESIRLVGTDKEIFLVHGHQGDLLNDNLHVLAKWLVRFIWAPLERIGVKDPTSAASNYRKCDCTIRRLCDFAQEKDLLMICGHTHRPVFPNPGEGSYFNDGSMVHPRCITALEVKDEQICLVKWAVLTRQDGTMYVGREILAGPEDIGAF